MTNNLVFADGTALPICQNDPTTAPRMMGGGWRWWHIEADNATTVEAVAKGISCREYESYTGVITDGVQGTEMLNEDLSAYVVIGCVVDHMDGTTTIWARRKSEIELLEEENAALLYELLTGEVLA